MSVWSEAGSDRNMLFVSHATPEDNEFARWLALQLAKEGFPTWCDLTKLLGGEPFWKEIEGAIRTRSRKFLFVLSRSSNTKDGTLAELSVASAVRRQLQDDRFIIPLRIDDLPFSDINIGLHQLNAIDFSKGWMAGFRKLIERLTDEGVETDKRFGTEAVAVWWREHFGENEGVSETTDYYCSNRLALRSLPADVTVLRLERELPKDFDLSTAPFAISPFKRVLFSFATMRDLLPFIEAEKLGLLGYESVATEDFLASGFGPTTNERFARNHTRFLLRQGFERLTVARGLTSYSLAGKRRFFWFPSDLVEDDKIHFTAAGGGKSWRGVVGYKSIKARDGKVRIRNWHFGVEGVPRIGLDSYIGIMPHVAFSEDGETYASTKKQHSCRRSQCKSWYNDDWRDRIIATLHFLAGGSEHLRIPLGSEAFAETDAHLQTIESPVSYVKTAPPTLLENESDAVQEEYEDEEAEEDDDE
ncbi:MAG: hypothetical protein QOE70_4754 [Chthoniobacter sp.]|jgi:hypothetical protein|nr:hypothetical protein [Chthoniobacter sp.]